MAQPLYRVPQQGYPGTRQRLTPFVPAGLADPPTEPSKLPFAIFCLYTFVLIGRPQDYLPFLQPFRLALVLTLLTSLVTLLFRSGGSNILRLPETRAYLIFFAAMCAGIPFSLYRRESFEFLFTGYIVNVVFFLLFVKHVNTLQRYKQIVLVLTTSAFLFSLEGLLGGEFFKGRFWIGGEMFDSNDTAFVELSLLPFSLSMLLGSFRLRAKALGLASVGLGIVLLLFTGSRGGLLGLTLTGLLFLILRIAGVGKSRKVILIGFIALVAVTNADKINVERYLTLRELSSDYNLSDESGRAQIWRRGVQLFLESPALGVGVGRFGEAIGTMRKEEDLAPKWQVSHNSYIQILSETGAFGAGMFLYLIGASLRNLNRLRRKSGSESIGRKDLSALSGVLLIGFAGQLLAATFLSQAYSVVFALFFAASATLRTLDTARDGNQLHA